MYADLVHVGDEHEAVNGEIVCAAQHPTNHKRNEQRNHEHHWDQNVNVLLHVSCGTVVLQTCNHASTSITMQGIIRILTSETHPSEDQ